MSIKPVGINESSGGEWERAVRQAVAGLRYGSVEVLVHEGRVVQVETRRKVRFADDRPADQRRRNKETDGRPDRQTGGAAPEESNE